MKNLSKLKPAIQIETKHFNHLKIQVLSSKPWYEYTDGVKNTNPSGIAVSTVIVEDNIEIDGYEQHANEFEKQNFNIRNVFDTDKFKYREIVIPYDFEKVTIYGDFQDKLSIICNLATEAEYKQMMASKAQVASASVKRQPLPKGTN